MFEIRVVQGADQAFCTWCHTAGKAVSGFSCGHCDSSNHLKRVPMALEEWCRDHASGKRYD
eukprot:6043156-Lingulodinium_polyedra.AAC.1